MYHNYQPFIEEEIRRTKDRFNDDRNRNKSTMKAVCATTTKRIGLNERNEREKKIRTHINITHWLYVAYKACDHVCVRMRARCIRRVSNEL